MGVVKVDIGKKNRIKNVKFFGGSFFVSNHLMVSKKDAERKILSLSWVEKR